MFNTFHPSSLIISEWAINCPPLSVHCPLTTVHFLPSSLILLHHSIHRIQAQRFTGGKRFAEFCADRPAPYGRLIADLFEEGGRFLRPAFDKLTAIATDCRQFPLPKFADIEHEGRLRNHVQDRRAGAPISRSGWSTLPSRRPTPSPSPARSSPAIAGKFGPVPPRAP